MCWLPSAPPSPPCFLEFPLFVGSQSSLPQRSLATLRTSLLMEPVLQIWTAKVGFILNIPAYQNNSHSEFFCLGSAIPSLSC